MSDYFTILIVDQVETLREITKSSFVKNCRDVHIDEASDKRDLQKRLQQQAYDLILINESFPIECIDLLKWMESQPFLRCRKYRKAATENFSRLIPPAHIMAPFSLPVMNSWIVEATEAAEKRTHERVEIQEVISYHVGDASVMGEVVNVCEGGVLGVFKRRKDIPPIAEKLIITLGTTDKQHLSDVQCFPVRIQTSKPLLNCSHVHLAVKFIELTEKQAEFLKSMIDLKAPESCD